MTTIKYTPSSPRSQTNADSKSSSLKYIVLERNRVDRTSTEEDELKHDSLSTTQRYEQTVGIKF